MTYPLAFQNPGGGEEVLLQLLNGLRSAGEQVDLFDPWKTKIANYDIVHYFSSYNWKMFRFISESGAKLVLTPVLWPADPNKIRRKARIKKLVFPNRFKDSFDFHMGFPHLITPTSSLEAARLTQAYPLTQGKMQVLPNGVDLQFKNGDANLFEKKFNIRDFVLSIGRFNANKNQLALIKACKSLNVPLVLIGQPDQWSHEYHQECIREASTNPNIKFLGYIADKTLLAAACKAARVFVLPSYFETCGIAALEAGLAGCPIVITQNGGAPEYFKNLALYMDPGSQQDLVAKLQSALNAPKNDLLSRHIEANYAWSAITRRLIELYQNI